LIFKIELRIALSSYKNKGFPHNQNYLPTIQQNNFVTATKRLVSIFFFRPLSFLLLRQEETAFFFI